ncbi:MAG: hypothetical protein M3R08_00590 [Bacteroidota bacterium]|nr:hypothetical protein [Bacteroidota bacterium]
MAFTNRPTVTLTLEQVLEVVDQLSDGDTLKVVKHIRKKKRNADVDDLIAIFSKVKLSDKKLTAIVEEERAKIHARQKAHAGRG